MRPTAPAIVQTAAFRFRSAEDAARAFETGEGYAYSRLANPTVALLERRLAALEGAEDAVAFASGMAAISAVFLELLSPGKRVVSHTDIYGSTVGLLTRDLARWGVEVRFEDLSDAASISEAVRGADLVFLESPGNPMLSIVDIGRVSEAAHQSHAKVVVDNTFATMVLQRPLALGADLVVYSATKFLSGHGDTLGGAVLGARADLEPIKRHILRNFGGVMSPFNAWLILRGLATLSLRMQAASESAARIAEFLAAHPAVSRVHYPGLSEFPNHDVARKQMSAFGAMITFDLNGGKAAAQRLLNSLRYFALAVSLGDVRSLAQHPATMTHAHLDPEQRAKAGITDGTVRLSIGIEDTEDLIADLDAALTSVCAEPR